MTDATVKPEKVAKKKRDLQNALECRFSGVIRVPLAAFDSVSLDKANAGLDTIEKSIVLPDGCEIKFAAERRPGKMEA